MRSHGSGLLAPRTVRSIRRAVLCGSLAVALAAGVAYLLDDPEQAEAEVSAGVSAAASSEQAAAATPAQIPIGNGLVATAGGGPDGLLLATGQAGLTWDSSVATITRADRFGPGWTFGTPYLNPGAAEQLYLPGLGLIDLDPSTESGLAGEVAGVVYTPGSGTVPARDGLVPARPYIATLRTADGATDYFDADGNVITTIDAAGARTDREYGDPGDGVDTRHLHTITDASGLVTTVEYDDLTKVTQPDGSTARFTLTGTDGRVSHIYTEDPFGETLLTNEFTYAAGGDGVTRMQQATVYDPTGELLDQGAFTWDTAAPAVLDRVWLGSDLKYQRG